MDGGNVDLDSNLTSSISDVLLPMKNDKTDANDSTPTSSTDAASSFSAASLNVSEDPISSTSTDLMEKDKLLETKTVNNEKDTIVPKNLLGTDGDVDLLDMNIADVSSEPINEDVEDIVQDLENLLGELEPQHDFSMRRKDKSPSEEKDLIAPMDAPLEVKSEPNIIPERSDAQTLERNNSDIFIQPESEGNEISLTEGFPNSIIECSLSGNDSSPKKQETTDLKPEEQNECVEELGKTEDSSCNTEELNVAHGQPQEVAETKQIQKETSSESFEGYSEVNEITEVIKVTSSEVKVDADDGPQESSHSTQLIPDIQEIQVEEVADHLISSEQISEDQDSSISVETKNQEVMIEEINAIASCETETNESYVVSQSKPENEPNSSAADQASENDQHTEESRDVDASEEQFIVSESGNLTSTNEETLSVKEPSNEVAASQNQLPVIEVEKQVEELIIREGNESMDLPISIETANTKLLQSFVDPSEYTDLENTSSEVPLATEEIKTEDAPTVSDELVDNYTTASTAEVIEESADDELKVEDISGKTPELAVEKEVDRNVTSSSDHLDNQDSEVMKPKIPDIRIGGSGEENCDIESEKLKESKESISTAAEESDFSIIDEQSVKHVEESITSEESTSEEIVEEKLESSISEFSTSDSNPLTEQAVIITDITISEQNSTQKRQISEETNSKVEEIPQETVSKVEEILEERISTEDSSASEGYSTKLENITETVEKSESVAKEIVLEQTIQTIIVEESFENENVHDTERKLLEISSETVLAEEITENELSSKEKPAEVITKKNPPEVVEKDKSAPLVVENVLGEEIVERDTLISQSSIIINDEPVSDEYIENIKGDISESSCVKNTGAAETSSKGENVNQESCFVEKKVELIGEKEHHPVEDMISDQIEECQVLEQETTKEDITQTLLGEVLNQGKATEESILPEDSKEAADGDAGQCIQAFSSKQNKEEILERVSLGETEKQNKKEILEIVPVEEHVKSIQASSKETGQESREESPENVFIEENKVTEEIIEKLDQTDAEKISQSEGTLAEANVETSNGKINTGESIAENTLEDSHLAVSAANILETISENEKITELPDESDDQKVKIVDFVSILDESSNQKSMESEKIIESIEETRGENVFDMQQSTEDHELVPVNEELCIRKKIIYEHKCESHNIHESSISSNEQKQDISAKETAGGESSDIVIVEIEAPVMEQVTAEESKDIRASSTDEVVTEKDQCIVDSSIIDKPQELKLVEQIDLSTISDIPHTLNIDNTIQDSVKDEVVNLHTPEQGEAQLFEESKAFEESISSSQSKEVTSSDQAGSQIKRITSVCTGPEDSKFIEQSSLENVEKTIEESHSERSMKEEIPVDTITEQIIEDQTTAAVQSILDNMLTEERSIEKIIEKEEQPIVHSSYSSYEVQKAVQEIQEITVDPVGIVSEDIECISTSEKPCELEKIEFESEKSMEINFGSQSNVVSTQLEQKETESLFLSKSNELHAADTTGSLATKEVLVDKVECAEEIIDSPSNSTEIQYVVTQSSYEDNTKNNEDVHGTKDQSLVSEDKSSSGTSQINEPVVVPSIDLSEESSTEEESDEDKKKNEVSSTVTSTSIIKESHSAIEDKETEPVPVKHVPKVEKVSGNTPLKIEQKKYSPRETRHSSRISERMKPHNSKEDINQPLSVNIDETEREKPYSPKITIKPIKEDEPNEDKEEHKGSLKITITKQSDNTHSILKMCSPDVEHRQKQSENEDQNVVPKLVIKTSDTHSDQHSPKMSTRSSKQVLPNSNIRSGSPRITIKPIIKPDGKETITSPLKITIKPIGKPEEFSRQQQRQSPKQVKNKTDDDHYSTRSKMTKSSENSDVHSPKVTIKPVKPPEEAELVSTPKITIKPIEKPEEARISPKITIKPVLRPVELDTEVEDEVKERIVLKINKGNLPTKDTERIGRESRKRELEDDKLEKLAKIKLKFSKDGDAHIVHKKDTEVSSNKRQQEFEIERSKRFRAEVTTDSDDDVKLIENTQSPIVISEDSQSQDSVILIEEARDPLAEVITPEPKPQVTPVSVPRKRGRPRKVPLVVREEFESELKERTTQEINTSSTPDSSTNQPIETEFTGRPKRSCRAQSVRDTLGIKPRKPSKPRGGKRGTGAKSISMKPEREPVYSEEKVNAIKKSLLTEEALQDASSSGILKVSESLPISLENKKEEPIKHLGLKSLLEAAKDQNIIEVIEIDTPSNSPKCLETVEIDKIEEERVVEENLLEKISETEKDLICVSDSINEIKNFEIRKDVLDLREDGDCNKESSDFGGTDAAASDVEMQPPTPVFAPPLSETSAVDISSTTDIAMFEEETRMSAEVSSRAQTPAKQVVSADVVVEESQSSIQSTATTESGKISRRSRLEVHQDQDVSVFTADQLNEYYWGGNGPFMIQEQVAQFLGIKSFKRKYPGIPRRMVDMQERDYIRENGLASESMCDLGLTAVNSADILDIMYTDFQEKYEEFCRFQREKQAKDLLNKQKALSTASNQEKSKLDILEQAVQSAAAYNANFNKTRREQRRACMDLQTMNIHYPTGKLKKINMAKIGNYPVAVVPGQFTDYYKEFTPTELNNLPLNTMLYTELHKILPEVSDSDSDSSGSDSDDSSSSGSESNSSCEDNCKMCDKGVSTPRKSPVNSSV